MRFKLVAIGVAIVFVGSLETHAAASDQPFSLRAKILNVVSIQSPSVAALPPNYLRTDIDANFAVTMRVISINPPLTNFTKGRTVTFAIHSPSQLFGSSKSNGKTYDFVLHRPQGSDGSQRLWKLETVQTQGSK